MRQLHMSTPHDCPPTWLPRAQAITKAAFKHNVLLMPAGARESIRFLPALNVSAEEVDIALDAFDKACAEVLGA